VIYGFSALAPLGWLFFVLAIGAFVIEIWAFADAARRPRTAFVAAGKQTKPIWLIILGVSSVIGLAGVVYRLSIVSILPVAAFVAGAIYLTDVRPKIKEIGGGSSRQGPYGPW
jgi:Protein of unknown function (DUF2516)